MIKPTLNKRLLNMLHSKHAKTRQKAVEKLEAIGSEEAFQLLLAALDDVASKVVMSAINALGYWGDSRALEKLIPLFTATQPSEALQTSFDGKKRIKKWVPDERYKVPLEPLIEALGRIGDPRALPLLTPDAVRRGSETLDFKLELRLSWAIAAIADRINDPAVKQQAAQQLLDVFPTLPFYNRYILHRLPWREPIMLDTMAELLSEPDKQRQAAVFLCIHGDTRGADLLLECLQHPEQAIIDPSFWHYVAVLTDLGNRRVVGVYLQLLKQPELGAHGGLLSQIYAKWGDTLSSDEHQTLRALAPGLVTYLVHGTVNLSLISGIRVIQSEEANRLLDDWLTAEISTLFRSFIERSDPADVPDDSAGLNLISRGFSAATQDPPDTFVLSHPMMRRYAFSALRARYEYLQERDPDSYKLNILIAYIGWLGDPQALPFLEEELTRSIQAEGETSDLFGEILYAIANIGNETTIPLLLSYLQHPNPYFRGEVIKPLRDFVRRIPDQRVVDALIEYLMTHDQYNESEIIEAIGESGAAGAVPGLLRFLSRRDEGCAAAITALAMIARKHNELIQPIVDVLTPLLDDKQKLRLPYFFYPVTTMPLDEYVAWTLNWINYRP